MPPVAILGLRVIYRLHTPAGSSQAKRVISSWGVIGQLLSKASLGQGLEDGFSCSLGISQIYQVYAPSTLIVLSKSVIYNYFHGY